MEVDGGIYKDVDVLSGANKRVREENRVLDDTEEEDDEQDGE